LLLLLLSSRLDPGAALTTGTLVLETASGSHRFNIEVTTNEVEREHGLMFRRSLPPDSGMLFVYESPRPVAMWMKNTPIPLDMVFIDAFGRVHRIETRTEPFSTAPISSEGEVLAILELNAGTADAIGLKAGDKVVFPGLGAPGTP
jgi:uncharacterized membrane protein (UPF0127 family)